MRIASLSFCIIVNIALSARGAWVAYDLPTANCNPGNLALGPDGNMWFIEVGTKVGRITPAGVISEFAANGAYYNIAAGPDGNLWFPGGGHQIGRVTPGGTVTFSAEIQTGTGVGATPNGMVLGPGNKMWFVEHHGNAVSSITPAFEIERFVLPAKHGFPAGITVGSDGNLWYLNANIQDRIGRFAYGSGTFTEFLLPQSNTGITGVTTGPDGNVWFLERFTNKVGNITPDGVITEYNVPTPNADLGLIVPGPDGNLWFTERGANKIGRITTAGVITEFDVPFANVGPNGLGFDAGNTLWIAAIEGNQIIKTDIVVPEPASMAGVAISMALMGLTRRRRKP